MNNVSTDYICEADYAAWNERSTIADCLRELGYPNQAEKALNSPVNIQSITKYVKLAYKQALAMRNLDVLNILASSGLDVLVFSQGGLFHE